MTSLVTRVRRRKRREMSQSFILVGRESRDGKGFWVFPKEGWWYRTVSVEVVMFRGRIRSETLLKSSYLSNWCWNDDNVQSFGLKVVTLLGNNLAQRKVHTNVYYVSLFCIVKVFYFPLKESLQSCKNEYYWRTMSITYCYYHTIVQCVNVSSTHIDNPWKKFLRKQKNKEILYLVFQGVSLPYSFDKSVELVQSH